MNEPWIHMQQLRRNLGLTQTELADGCVGQSQISLFEQGVLMPSNPVILLLAAKLGADGNEWIRAWQPHRLIVEMRNRFWRAFVRREVKKLFNLLAQQPLHSLDADCYRLWRDTQTAVHPSASARLREANHRVLSDYRLYLPKTMNSTGDIRLRIVLALTESNICKETGRFRSAALWDLLAHRLMMEVPVYWK